MPPVGFEPTISAGERPKTYALDRAATGTGERNRIVFFILYRPIFSPFVENSAIGTIGIMERRGARQNLGSSSEEQEASKIEARFS